MRQTADQGLKAQFMSGDGIVSNELAAIAGPAVEGTLMTFAPDPRNIPPADVVDKFKAAGFEPEAYTLYSYAALQIVAAAANKVGKSDDAQAVAAAIKASGPWATAIGDIGYNEKGDITRPDYVMYTWTKQADGTFTYIQNPIITCRLRLAWFEEPARSDPGGFFVGLTIFIKRNTIRCTLVGLSPKEFINLRKHGLFRFCAVA